MMILAALGVHMSKLGVMEANLYILLYIKYIKCRTQRKRFWLHSGADISGLEIDSSKI